MSFIQSINNPLKLGNEGVVGLHHPLNITFIDLGSFGEFRPNKHGGFVREGKVGRVEYPIYRNVSGLLLSKLLNPQVSFNLGLSGKRRWDKEGCERGDKERSFHGPIRHKTQNPVQEK